MYLRRSLGSVGPHSYLNRASRGPRKTTLDRDHQRFHPRTFQSLEGVRGRRVASPSSSETRCSERETVREGVKRLLRESMRTNVLQEKSRLKSMAIRVK